jgi:hypothetical protein
VRGIFDREHQLDAFIQVAAHPVRAGEEQLFVSPVEKVVHARVLQEAIDDGDDLDAVADAGHTRPQRANAPDVQADANPGLRCCVQRANDVLVDERVHLRDDFGRLPRFGASAFAIDQFPESRTQVGWREDEFLEPGRIGISGQRIEEGAGILRDRA